MILPFTASHSFTRTLAVSRSPTLAGAYFDGKDHQWLESSSQFARTGLYGELESFRTPEELSARIVALRQEMRPLFGAIERQDPSITTFFSRFRRVW
jgi:hypothetical protein